jgi:alpha-methylacyl-CoA racemase
MRIVEIAGIGPAPFAAMLLADMGAEVIRIDRRARVDLGTPVHGDPRFEVLRRGRRSVAVDLKTAAGRDVVLRLITKADALIEGFRPGVMERLGLGPDACLAVNPRLVYGRVTGFGQQGPLAERAGHDIDYIALAGVLASVGEKGGPPVPPLNLVGDFGGGGMFLAFGILAARLSALQTGRGQVVDAAMVDGAAYLLAPILGLHSAGLWRDERGTNLLDGSTPWYGVYATADDRYMAVGAIERRFYDELIDKLGLAGETLPNQHDRSGWPLLRERFAAAFRSRTAAEWEQIFSGSDACVVPVLTLGDAPRHPHNRARGTFIERNGVTEPAPAPRFDQTPAAAGHPPRPLGADTDAVLADWGFSSAEIEDLKRAAVVGCE